MATQILKADLEEKVTEYENLMVEVVGEIDDTDDNRIEMRQCLEDIRNKIENVYGDSLTDDVNEYLGIENDEDDLDEDEDDLETYE